MIKTTAIVTAGLFVATATFTATQSIADVSRKHELSRWEKEALYEPCMNGAVSSSGLYPSQIAEDKSISTLGFLATR